MGGLREREKEERSATGTKREKEYERRREGGMQRWENDRSKERDDGIEVATEGRREVEGKEDVGIETGAEREVKTERGPGRRETDRQTCLFGVLQ